MDLSVITVTWNAEGQIERQIRSTQLGCKNITFEQIVIDNASKDDTIKIINGIVGAENFLPLRLIKNTRNAGFSYPNNQAAKISTGDFLLFLNPDMKVEEGSLDIIVNWMRERPSVGIVSCKLVKELGEVETNALPRRFPTVWNQLAILFKIPRLFPAVLNSYLYKGFDANKEQEVDSVRGSFMLMRRELYNKLGWAFDPRYYIWFEDVDVCREAKRLGYKVMYAPVISCVDKVGQSFKRRNIFWRQYNFFTSAVKYFIKWGIN